MKEKIKLAVGCFAYGCSDTFCKWMVPLPDKVKLPVRIGRALVSGYVSDRVASYYIRITDSVMVVFEEAKSIIEATADEIKERLGEDEQ